MVSTHVRGCCPLDCQDTCSWLAHVVDGVVQRVEGARGHPITRGSLCAKVNDYEQRTYAPDRILHPLRRVGPKGEGRFEPVTWDTALDTIAQRFHEIIARHGPAALLSFDYLGSMGVVQRRALRRIFHALGASRQTGSVCGASGNVLEAEGTPRGFDPEEFVHSQLILLWGSNLLSTSHHTFAFMLEARRLHGARLIAIDPRRTITAARCDLHLPIRPGTDHILALAIGHVLLREELADCAFASRAAVDFKEYAAEASRWSPREAAELCGVPAQQIFELAREFGRARPAAIRAGIAPQQTIAGEQFVRSMSALAVIGGHWQLPGGGLFIEANPMMNEAAAGLPALGREGRPLDMARLGEHLSGELDPPIGGLMVWGANPAVSQPDSKRVRQGLAREDLFLVVAEHFITDTARFADIVLPSTTQLEHFDVQGAWGHHYISANLPAITPLGQSKSHGEIMRLLAPKLGLHGTAFSESDEEIATSVLPAGVTLEDLKARGFIKSSPPRPAFGPGGITVRLHEIPTRPQAPPPAGLQLLTPKAHQFLNSTFVNMPRQRAAEGGPTLQMHPADAAVRGLASGMAVRLQNERGHVSAVLHVSADISAGTVSLAGKWWNMGSGNLLTSGTYSPGGQPAYNDTYVEVVKEASPASTLQME